MDNFSIDVTAEGRETLADVLRIAFRHRGGGKCTHWMEKTVDAKAEWMDSGGKRTALVLLWSAEASACPFPVPLNAEGATEMAWRWLAEAPFGKQPGHDGDNGKGFRIYCDHWGRFEGLNYSIVGIVPAWAMYGK